MQRTDIGANFGSYLNYAKWTLTYQDLSAAAATQAITLTQNPVSGGAVTIGTPANLIIPQGGVVLYTRIKPVVAFAAPALTTMTLSIGKAGGSATFLQAAYSLQTVSDTALQEAGFIASAQHSSWSPNVTFTAGVALLNAVFTAGQVDVYICWLNISTASAPATLPNQSGGGTGV